jgi:hypothetical protein
VVRVNWLFLRALRASLRGTFEDAVVAGVILDNVQSLLGRERARAGEDE